jgi:hypothetical protein
MVQIGESERVVQTAESVVGSLPVVQVVESFAGVQVVPAVPEDVALKALRPLVVQADSHQ